MLENVHHWNSARAVQRDVSGGALLRVHVSCKASERTAWI